LLLVNHLAPGDVTVMTAAVHSLHLANPGMFLTDIETTAPSLWENNPLVTPMKVIEKKLGVAPERVEMHYPLVHQSNQRAVHFMEAYCAHLAHALKVPVPLMTSKPLIYLSRKEKAWLPRIAELAGKARPYWVINGGVKEDFTAKQYPFFQEVVDRLQGKILFIQVGEAHHMHTPLKGALNEIGKTDTRQLIRLIYHSRGVLSGVSLPMHLAAALEKPAVVLAGGREPRSWNTYPRQVLLSTVGQLDCCREGACWKSHVVPLGEDTRGKESLCLEPVPTDPPSGKCMAVISPEEVAREILRYES
jgi:ADP-heptose:LPS heptosyltransferase